MRMSLILCAVIATTSCARIQDSRLNPLNWFGASQAVPLTPTGELKPLVPQTRQTKVVDSRGLVQAVTAMAVERTPNGALVRATGVASTQGQFNAQLVPVSSTNGVLTLAFRIEAAANTVSGTAASRQVTVARMITTQNLQGIRSIRVQSATNQRAAAR